MKKRFLSILFLLIGNILNAQIDGNSLRLYNDENYVSIADPSSATLNNKMTIELWLYYRCGNIGGELLSKGRCNVGNAWSFGLRVTSNNTLELTKWYNGLPTDCNNNLWATFKTTDSISNNTWTHLALVVDDLDVKFYINGILANSSLVSGNNGIGFQPSEQPLYIGAYQNLNGSMTTTPKSNIDEVRIWHVARTQSEIQENMNHELLGNENGLVAYYKMNETGNGGGINVQNSAIGSPIPDGTTVGSPFNLEFRNNSQITNDLPVCGPIAWHRADTFVYKDNGATIAQDGDSIQQWNDISGNGYHFIQTDVNHKPKYSSVAINGKPAIIFDGSDILQTITQVNWNNTTNNDVFVVCLNTSPDAMLYESSPSVIVNNGTFYLIDNYTTGSNGISCALKGNNGGFRIFKNLDGFIPCPKIYQVTNDMSIPGSGAINVKLNNTNMSDGGGYNSGTPSGGLTNQYLYTGSRADGTYGMNGYIAEIIAYPSKLSPSNANKVYQYLYQKYFTGMGLAQFNSLPSDTINFNNAIYYDGSWRHSYNSNAGNEIIASIKDNCNNLGTRTDSVFVEPMALLQEGTYMTMRRHYTIKTALNPAGTKVVRLYFTNSDFADLQAQLNGLNNINQLGVIKYNGLNEDRYFNSAGGGISLINPNQITAGTAFGQYYLEFEVSGFSEFWIYAPGLTPLPLTFISLDAQKTNWPYFTQLGNG
ncbi:MAG: PKD domain-containing protein [Bacteroidetes bacterium OLB11]|nr:MAG: PKD domain-containing protein [Bacteroidetes bacterium OLB11]